MSQLTIPRSCADDVFYHYKMPPLAVKVEGKGKMVMTQIVNLGAVAEAFEDLWLTNGQRTWTARLWRKVILRWFGLALGATTEVNGGYISGTHEAEQLQTLLDRFINSFVLCPACQMPEVQLRLAPDSNHTICSCSACSWSGKLDTTSDATTEKLERYIVRLLSSAADTAGSSEAGGSCAQTRKQKKAELQRAAAALGGAAQVDEDADMEPATHEDAPASASSSKKEKRKARGGKATVDSGDSDASSEVPPALPLGEREISVHSAVSSTGCSDFLEDLELDKEVGEHGELSAIDEGDELAVDEVDDGDAAIGIAALAPQVMARKQRERRKMKRGQVGQREAAAEDITLSTHTKNAAGNAVKAERLCLTVGNASLLEDAELKISDDVKCYGLVGPNGCGKTTLMRLVAGRYAPQCCLPMPRAWGDPYLVDQLDPEPSGRSPVEDVLAGCTERAALLEQQKELEEELEKLCETSMAEGRDYSDKELARIEQIAEDVQDVDHKLSKFDKDVQDVTRILVGLGFHNGDDDDVGADGAPSLRRKDELVTDTSGLRLNSHVEVRDRVDEEWLRGVVTSFDPLLVQPDGWTDSLEWVEVRQPSELSGGWRKKVNLAKALYVKPHLLLLDEPTNHLDFHALLWLEEELKAYPNVVVIVSHNADFLANACSRVLHIVNKQIKVIAMNELSPEHVAQMQRQDELGCKFKDWRFAYPPGDNADEHGLSFHKVDFQYPGGPLVVQGLDCDPLRFSGQSRTVILGRNGSGKSTIIKLCLGLIEATEGSVDGRYGDHGGNCKVGHYSQHFNEQLDQHPEDSAASYLARECREGLVKRFKVTDGMRLRERCIELLSSFGLPPEAAGRSLGDLSGGQKARVNFAFLSLQAVHLIFLDEPTNHLDASGMEHLAEAIMAFDGGVVLVSHDEALIRKFLNSVNHSRLLVCKDGGVTTQQPSGSQGLTEYRREAFRDQQEKALRAAAEAAGRLEIARQKQAAALERARGGRGGRGRKRTATASLSAASSLAPTPSVSRETSPSAALKPQPDQKVDPKKPTLQDLCKPKAKKKPFSSNLNRRDGPA